MNINPVIINVPDNKLEQNLKVVLGNPIGRFIYDIGVGIHTIGAKLNYLSRGVAYIPFVFAPPIGLVRIISDIFCLLMARLIIELTYENLAGPGLDFNENSMKNTYHTKDPNRIKEIQIQEVKDFHNRERARQVNLYQEECLEDIVWGIQELWSLKLLISVISIADVILVGVMDTTVKSINHSKKQRICG